MSRMVGDTTHCTDAESSQALVVAVSEGSLIHTASNPFC